MSKLICASCGKEIKENEPVARFNDGGRIEFTHVMNAENSYDCDYLYMIETCCPIFYGDKSEIEEE